MADTTQHRREWPIVSDFTRRPADCGAHAALTFLVSFYLPRYHLPMTGFSLRHFIGTTKGLTRIGDLPGRYRLPLFPLLSESPCCFQLFPHGHELSHVMHTRLDFVIVFFYLLFTPRRFMSTLVITRTYLKITTYHCLVFYRHSRADGNPVFSRISGCPPPRAWQPFLQ